MEVSDDWGTLLEGRNRERLGQQTAPERTAGQRERPLTRGGLPWPRPKSDTRTVPLARAQGIAPARVHSELRPVAPCVDRCQVTPSLEVDLEAAPVSRPQSDSLPLLGRADAVQVRAAYGSLESVLDAVWVTEERDPLGAAILARMMAAVAAAVGPVVETAPLEAGLEVVRQDA